jgi:hypothetical protein
MRNNVTRIRTPSVASTVTAAPAAGVFPDIVDDLMNTESLLATAIAAVDTDGVDPEDVQIALVIVRERLHGAMERLRAAK